MPLESSLKCLYLAFFHGKKHLTQLKIAVYGSIMVALQEGLRESELK